MHVAIDPLVRALAADAVHRAQFGHASWLRRSQSLMNGLLSFIGSVSSRASSAAPSPPTVPRCHHPPREMCNPSAPVVPRRGLTCRGRNRRRHGRSARPCDRLGSIPPHGLGRPAAPGYSTLGCTNSWQAHNSTREAVSSSPLPWSCRPPRRSNRCPTCHVWSDPALHPDSMHAQRKVVSEVHVSSPERIGSPLCCDRS